MAKQCGAYHAPGIPGDGYSHCDRCEVCYCNDCAAKREVLKIMKELK